MELLYLRIFNTNTDHNLSFTNKDINFNGQHTFFLNEKKGNFEYAENKAYVKELYGINTNVTGLIGGNGVGKTTFLKFLQYLIARLENLEINHSYRFDTWNWVAIVNKEDGLNITYGGEADNYDYNKFEFTPFKANNFADDVDRKLSTSIFYSPHLDLEEPNFDNPDYINVSSDFLMYLESRDKEDTGDSQIINFRKNETKRQIAFIEFADLEENKNIQFYNHFKRDTISVSFNQFVKKFDTEPRYLDLDNYETYKQIDKQFLSYSSDLNYNLRRKRSGTDGELARLWFYKRLFELIHYNAEYRGEKHIDDKSYRLSIIKDFKVAEDNIIQNFETFFSNQLLINPTKLALLLSKLNNLLSDYLKYEENDKSFTCSLDTAKELMTIESEIFKLLPYEIQIPLFVFDWSGMSTGEKAYLNLFSRLHYGFNQLGIHTKIQDSQRVYFLIDEPSTGFHPQWQKEYLDKLLSFLAVRFEGEKHLIISSHSPFLASDLQKEDVVALSINSVQNSFIENTFAANIHELLADSFFLQDGFIGDFAKNKVDKLILFLTSETDFTEEKIIEAQKLINIIGEPLIKDRLQEIFDVKFKSKIEIEKEIERLQNLLKVKQNEKNQS